LFSSRSPGDDVCVEAVYCTLLIVSMFRMLPKHINIVSTLRTWQFCVTVTLSNCTSWCPPRTSIHWVYLCQAKHCIPFVSENFDSFSAIFVERIGFWRVNLDFWSGAWIRYLEYCQLCDDNSLIKSSPLLLACWVSAAVSFEVLFPGLTLLNRKGLAEICALRVIVYVVWLYRPSSSLTCIFKRLCNNAE